MNRETVDISYFPGCSLATTSRENDQSLRTLCRRIGFNLISLDDWNCCGSSSVYALEPEASFHLSSRNLSLAPKGLPLLVACPKCLLRLRQAQLKLKQNETARESYREMWGKHFDEKLNIISFFELLDQGGFEKQLNTGFLKGLKGLGGMKVVVYYGCMLNAPPGIQSEKSYYGRMERVLSLLGAVPVDWPCASRCCGTFLSVARPDIASRAVKDIMSEAVATNADCIVTACAMCHLNLEVRHGISKALPVFHFSEILALALTSEVESKWFSRHLVDPRPILNPRGLLEGCNRVSQC